MTVLQRGCGKGAAPTVFLEYGADAAECDDQGFDICERGMRLQACWQFEEGTRYGVTFSYQDADGLHRNVVVEAMVVGCEQVRNHCYESTLLFLDLPEELRGAIGDVSRGLEAQVGHSGEITRHRR